MKIKDHDFLWQCYLRVYKDQPVPHPSNLCSFFWTAIGGFIAKMFCDFNFGLVLVAFIASIYAMIQVAIWCNNLLVIPLGLGAFVMMFATIFLVAIRLGTLFAKYIGPLFSEKTWERINLWFACTIMLGIPTAAIIKVIFWGVPDGAWDRFLSELPVLLIMLGSFFGGILLLCAIWAYVFYPLSTTETFKTLMTFFKAKKDKVCPVVEPPDSWQAPPEKEKVAA